MYYWRYTLIGDNHIRSEWSKVRAFVVADELPLTPLPSRTERYTAASGNHPRLWLQAEQLESYRETIRQDPDLTGWSDFLKHSVLPGQNERLFPSLHRIRITSVSPSYGGRCIWTVRKFSMLFGI